MGLKTRSARVLRASLARTGYALVRADRATYLEHCALVAEKAARLGFLDGEGLGRAVRLLSESPSQLNQDFFVLDRLGWTEGGYFVEFGAADGRSFSNTLLLERRFGWRGILAEPARVWREALKSSGRAARLEFDCVWSKSGETLGFAEADWAELSTLAAAAGRDGHDRTSAGRYGVQTVSLTDMLERHGAPPLIDYLSIDTEGSEYDILAAHDFARFGFRCITCEHNFSDQREAIRMLLEGKGYSRVLSEHSAFDDWYVLVA